MPRGTCVAHLCARVHCGVAGRPGIPPKDGMAGITPGMAGIAPVPFPPAWAAADRTALSASCLHRAGTVVWAVSAKLASVVVVPLATMLP